MAKASAPGQLKIKLSDSKLLRYGGGSIDTAVVMMGDPKTDKIKDKQ